jgi:hypothetical protein
VTCPESYPWAALPNAVGVFTGTYDSAAAEQFFGPPPPLIPVEIDTNDQPNPAARLVRDTVLTLTIADRRWSFRVDHVDHIGGNRWNVWCYRDSIHEVTQMGDGTDG